MTGTPGEVVISAGPGRVRKALGIPTAGQERGRCVSYIPHSSRSVSQISPTVQRARSASRIGGSRFASPRAASRTAALAAAASSAFRSARTAAVRSSWRRSAAGSMRNSSIRSASSSWKRLTPTMTRSPDSTCCWNSNAALLDLLLHEARLDRGDGASRARPPARSAPTPAPRARPSATRCSKSLPAVGGPGGARLCGDDLLRTQRDMGRVLARQREGLVEGVRVEALRTAGDG